MSNATHRFWTIGHSTRPMEDFVALLQENRVETLADVRRFPGSRRYPHFNSDALAKSLQQNDIEYLHFPELGGRRKPDPNSLNTVWRNESFRAYADFLETPEFAAGLDRLLEAGAKRRLAMMCSEAVWWRCHRSLLADVLKSRGYEVIHILGPGKTEEHPYTSAAKIVEGKLSYRGEVNRTLFE
jgi:uncharacterized protein (DUF488 family)